MNILQGLHGQSSHFHILMQFLKRAREVGQHDTEQHQVRISINEGFLSGKLKVSEIVPIFS